MADPTFHYVWRWSLRSSPDKLWPFVSNTDRFRAATGFPPTQYTEEPIPTGGVRRMARFRMYGFPIVWEEQPFEWVLNRQFSETHNYTVGPLRYVHVHIRLDPRADGGTDLTYEVWARPGNTLGYPGIPIQIGLFSRARFGRAFRKMDDFIQSIVPIPFETPRTPLSPAGQTRLREVSSALINAGHNETLVNHLVDHLTSAPDDHLTRMRPFALADAWDVDRFETLEMFLRATKLGALDLSWDMICPHCRGAKRQSRSLDGVTQTAYCPSCNVDFEVDFARSVEATFQINASIKPIDRNEYCIASPQNTPHILLQQFLSPGETRTLTVQIDPQRYRWRAPWLMGRTTAPRPTNTPSDLFSERSLLKVGISAANQASAVIIDNDAIWVEGDDAQAGMVTLTLRNESARPQVFLLEQTAWSDQTSTAAQVTALQAFRDLFSSEALRPGESISVESLAIMFTDLKGSTAMYRTVGDAPAFRRVMDHFAILREGVANNQGGLVKTIGDAIMAVFVDPLDAVTASLQILEGFRAYNEANPGQELTIKMGIHKGACIAVTLNDRLDYFGTVVNLAARLEGQSQGHDVVISEAVATDPTIIEYLEANHIRVEPFTATLKGFADSFSLRRLMLPAITTQTDVGQSSGVPA